ncbi:MAG: protein NO VEIN domain-containing protein [Candidatus Dormibacteria bacterium]
MTDDQRIGAMAAAVKSKRAFRRAGRALLQGQQRNQAYADQAQTFLNELEYLGIDIENPGDEQIGTRRVETIGTLVRQARKNIEAAQRSPSPNEPGTKEPGAETDSEPPQPEDGAYAEAGDAGGEPPTADTSGVSVITTDPPAGVSAVDNLGPSITPEELAQKTRDAEEIGQRGEALVDRHLLSLKQDGSIGDYKWCSKDHALAPYDFLIVGRESVERFVDVKSTKGGFAQNPIHVSFSELEQMCAEPAYDLYRTYDLGGQPRMQIALGVNEWARSIRSTIALPAEIRVESLAVSTLCFQWEPAVVLPG